MKDKQNKPYIIVTDSCADLSVDLIKEMELEVIPLTVDLEGVTYYNYPDERDLKFKDFYSKLRNKMVAITSLVSVGRFLEFFEELLHKNVDILYIGFSSALSGTYHSGVLAAEEINQRLKTKRIWTIDSRSASMGQGLLIHYAYLKKIQGYSIEKLYHYVEENKFKICHLFTVDDLGTLQRGGRLSAPQYLLGSLLKVKPILHVSNEGKLVPIKKARGRRTSLDTLIEIVKSKIKNPKDQTIMISHGDSIEDATYVGNKIKEEVGVSTIIYGYVGPVIGAHSGPGTIAVFFIGNER
jgi:DegV family protein with EDD domain